MKKQIMTTALLAFTLLAPAALSTQSVARSFGEPCKANEVEDVATTECRPLQQSEMSQTQGLVVKQKINTSQPKPYSFSDSPDRSQKYK